MAEQSVPADVRDFLLKHIASVAQIEALLLICSGSREGWRLREIARRIYASESDVARALDGLCSSGLLNCADGVFRSNASAENADMIRKVRDVYARNLIPVTDIIHGRTAASSVASQPNPESGR